MKFRPYIAIDLETTGLDTEKAQILEMAAILDDGMSDVKDLPKFYSLVHYSHIEYGEFEALNMNKDLLYKLAKPTKNGAKTFNETINQFVHFVEQCVVVTEAYEGAKKKEDPNHWYDKRPHIVGKAAPTFDWPIIINQIKKHSDRPQENLAFFDENVHFWIGDVGSLYMADFEGRVPTMNQINMMLGREKVLHQALSDAEDIVHAMRRKLVKV